MAKKKAPDLFGDDEELAPKGTSEFEKLLSEEDGVQKKLSPGDTFRGELITIGSKEAFVTTGTPIDGALPIRDLLDQDNQLKFKVGDQIDVRVVRVGDAEILLKRLGATNSSSEIKDLQEAFELELPVDGKVVEITKGGFRVDLMGKLAFCPLSQMDFHIDSHVDFREDFVGKRYLFLITKYDQGGRNLVVSRRRILEMQRFEAGMEFREKKQKGDVFQGRIVRIERYGAFVELEGGIQGLIPISELAWGRVSDPSSVVSLHQTVQVMLLEAVEFEGRLRLSFSLKQGGGEGDPWIKVINDFPPGRIFEGRVEKREAFGLFISLLPGVTGLLPKSKYADAPQGSSYEKLKKGDSIQVQVDEVRFEEKRISLSPPKEKDDLSWKSYSSGATGKGFGSFGDLLKDVKVKK